MNAFIMRSLSIEKGVLKLLKAKQLRAQDITLLDYLELKANHPDDTFVIGGNQGHQREQTIEVKRGEFVIPLRRLQRELGFASEKGVRSSLGRLHKYGLIHIKKVERLYTKVIVHPHGDSYNVNAHIKPLKFVKKWTQGLDARFIHDTKGDTTTVDARVGRSNVNGNNKENDYGKNPERDFLLPIVDSEKSNAISVVASSGTPGGVPCGSCNNPDDHSRDSGITPAENKNAGNIPSSVVGSDPLGGSSFNFPSVPPPAPELIEHALYLLQQQREFLITEYRNISEMMPVSRFTILKSLRVMYGSKKRLLHECNVNQNDFNLRISRITDHYKTKQMDECEEAIEAWEN